MPRRVSYRLQWSEEVQVYELYDENACISSISFQSRSGAYCTVRKEKMQRGDSYWYAYGRLLPTAKMHM
jgi:LuxR family maltose regulon positive regulatory protein